MALLRADHLAFGLVLHHWNRRHPALLICTCLRVKVHVVSRSLGLESDARVARRSHNLGLYVEKGHHSIEVKVICSRVFHLHATAVDEALESKHFAAVQV